jgi:deazaflavin-dependent oxidoreductase (nitroreductase family)
MQIHFQRIEPYLPAILKCLNFFVVLFWKLGLGKLLNIWPSVCGRILVVRNSGRASGTTYLTPVNFAEKDGAIYVVAGFGAQSDWYQNILANQQVEIWLPDGWFVGQAVQADDSADRLEHIREVLIASGFAAPLFGINPKTISDMELAAAADSYRLVRITRQAACTGADGPGGMAWIWPFILAVVWLKKRKR